jgi:hypothetical protein
MTHLTPTKPLLAGAGAAILIAGALALLLNAKPADGASAIVTPFLVNCAAAASLVTRFVVR